MSASEDSAIPGVSPSTRNTGVRGQDLCQRRKRILTKTELERIADHLSEISSEDNDFSSDDNLKNKDYVPSDDKPDHFANFSDVDTSAEDELNSNGSTPPPTPAMQSDNESDWTDTEADPLDIPFTRVPSFTSNLDNNAKPIDYFRLFIDDAIINTVVTETNNRAKTLAPVARNTRKKLKAWKDVTPPEITKFIGLCLLSGTIHFPRLSRQWSQKSFYFHPVFGKCMSRNRFCDILRFLREELMKDMLQIPDTRRCSRPTDQESEFHYLEPVPSTPKDKLAMKRCRQCSKGRLHKKSRYHCPICPENPGLCVHPCFRLWHSVVH
ncbi:Transposase IS4 [Popillia japonica]|uniref:Transposase IS4 n=1 Tax=Popillia japonica TaxID=7064 RepID=A0AAW1HUJ5_POPJA